MEALKDVSARDVKKYVGVADLPYYCMARFFNNFVDMQIHFSLRPQGYHGKYKFNLGCYTFISNSKSDNWKVCEDVLSFLTNAACIGAVSAAGAQLCKSVLNKDTLPFGVNSSLLIAACAAGVILGTAVDKFSGSRGK